MANNEFEEVWDASTEGDGSVMAYILGDETGNTENANDKYLIIAGNGAGKIMVNEDSIEDLVVAAAIKMVMDDDVVDAFVSMLMDMQGRENTNLPLYQRQLRETETKIAKPLKAITEGAM